MTTAAASAAQIGVFVSTVVDCILEPGGKVCIIDMRRKQKQDTSERNTRQDRKTDRRMASSAASRGALLRATSGFVEPFL